MSIFANTPSVPCKCQRCDSPFTVFKLRRVRKNGRVRWNLPPISKRRTEVEDERRAADQRNRDFCEMMDGEQ